MNEKSVNEIVTSVINSLPDAVDISILLEIYERSGDILGDDRYEEVADALFSALDSFDTKKYEDLERFVRRASRMTTATSYKVKTDAQELVDEWDLN